VLYWLVFALPGALRWTQPVYWLIYPLAYIAYSLMRGALIGRYPYPFADVHRLGYPAVLVNAVAFLIGFYLLGLLAVAIDRVIGRIHGRNRQGTPIR
jgi:hypothetical protein